MVTFANQHCTLLREQFPRAGGGPRSCVGITQLRACFALLFRRAIPYEPAYRLVAKLVALGRIPFVKCHKITLTAVPHNNSFKADRAKRGGLIQALDHMWKPLAGLLIFMMLGGCSTLSTYAVAADEMNSPGGYGTYYCWSRDFVGPCETAASTIAVSECVETLGAEHGYVHSRARSRKELVECMQGGGWHRIKDFTLIH